MDNAIEAAKENQGDILRLLMQQGYTTKENHTGLGLVGLEQIVRKYPNILHNYSCMNHRFVQEIIITDH